MSFTKFVYHIVFSTKNREKTIPVEHERPLYKILYNIMNNAGAHVYRIGGMSDHIHVLTDIPSSVSVGQFIKKVKQESSYTVANMPEFRHWDGWENGYGAFTYSINDIDTIKEYIINQKEHHKKVSFRDEYRQWLIENGVSPDAPYFPK